MRVYMNKVAMCRDLFTQYNNVLQGLQTPDEHFPEAMMGEEMVIMLPSIVTIIPTTRARRFTESDLSSPLSSLCAPVRSKRNAWRKT